MKSITLTKQIFLLFLFVFVLSKTTAQTTSIFTQLNITEASLNVTQKARLTKIKKFEGYKSIKFVSIGNIANIQVNNKVKLSLPNLINCPALIFETINLDYKSNTNYNWYGQCRGDSADSNCYAGNFFLLALNGKIKGSLSIEDKKYEILDLTGNVYAFNEINNQFNYGCGNANTQQSGSSPNTNSASNTTSTPNSLYLSSNSIGSGSPPTSNPCVQTKTRILFLYTNASLNHTNDITLDVTFGLGQLLQAWNNSQVSYYPVEIAGILPLSNFTENILGGGIDVDINQLPTNTTILALRNQYKADIVMLITAPVYNSTYGKAIINANFTSSTFQSNQAAFCIVTVNSFVSGNYAFPHEIGHIYGARHRLSQDPTVGQFHACKFRKNIFYKWRCTLMNEAVNENNLIPYFSNPNISYANCPIGTFANENNAKTCQDEQTRIADFYPNDPVLVKAAISGSVVPINNWNTYTINATADLTCGTPPFIYSWKLTNGFSTVYSNSFTSATSSNTISIPLLVMNNSFGMNIYKLQLLAIDANGNSDITLKFVTFDKFNTTTFKLADIQIVNEVFQKGIDGEIRYNVEDNQIGIIKIYNVAGKLVDYQENILFDKNKKSITIVWKDKLKSGIYVLKIICDGIEKQEKFIVE
jgi:Metallo-peptidase family M12B Reprolysin-like